MLSHVIDIVAQSVYANHAALRTGIEFLPHRRACHRRRLRDDGGPGRRSKRPVRPGRRRPTHCNSSRRRTVWSSSASWRWGERRAAAWRRSRDVCLLAVFWLKMALMALLLVNGVLLLRGERRAARGQIDAWPRLHHTAIASLVLLGC